MGRVAVVTGAAQGLGQAIADRLAGDRYDVVYADLDAKGAKTAAAATGSLGVEVDIRELYSLDSGRIVNLASIAGQRGASVNGIHYAASKAGIVAITRFAASELASSGVTVNAIAPAAIDGPSVATVSAETIEAMVKTIPVGRLGRPKEVAALVAYLASDEAGFVTGATYDINGGMLMR